MAASMEKIKLSFVFSDDSFVNWEVRVTDWNRAKASGEWYVQQFITDTFCQNNFKAPGDVHQIVEGGNEEFPAGMLYRAGQPVDAQPACCGSLDDSGLLSEGNAEWTRPAVLLLIEKYRELRHWLNDPRKKRTDMWKSISSELVSKGYSFSAQQSQKKFDNMKSRYKSIKDKHSKMGGGRSSWPYYEMMDNLLRDDHAITPPIRISSISGPTVSVSEDISSESTDEPANAEASIPLAKGKMKRQQRQDPPEWYKELDERRLAISERLAAAQERRNELIEKLLEKL